MVPEFFIFPIGTVDNRIRTDAAKIDTVLNRQRGLLGHLPDPHAAAAADVTGFRQQHRLAVALVQLLQQLMERHAAWIIEVPPQAQIGAAFPLVGVVVVDADQIHVARIAAQFRLAAAAQHVESLELRLAPMRGLRGPIRPLARGDHMDQRIALQDSGFRIDFPDGLAAGDGGANQLPLAFAAGIRVIHVLAMEHVGRQTPTGK